MCLLSLWGREQAWCTRRTIHAQVLDMALPHAPVCSLRRLGLYETNSSMLHSCLENCSLSKWPLPTGIPQRPVLSVLTEQKTRSLNLRLTAKWKCLKNTVGDHYDIFKVLGCNLMRTNAKCYIW